MFNRKAHDKSSSHFSHPKHLFCLYTLWMWGGKQKTTLCRRQSHYLFSVFSRRKALLAVKLFIFSQKCCGPSQSCSFALWKAIAAGHTCSLSGWVWWGMRNFLSEDMETLSGHSNKGLTPRKTHQCLRGFAWHSSKHNEQQPHYKTIIDGFSSYGAISMINRQINRSIWD